MSVRLDIADLIREDWKTIPELAELRVIATERLLDALAEPTAIIRLRRIEREPSAPQKVRRVSLLLTIVSEHLDLDLAAEDLEEFAAAAIDYLGPRFKHDPAEVVGYGDRLAVDIPLYVIAAPAAPTPEEN
ncbi:hypothetical protein ACTJJ4_03055 [Microbacterium sp. 22195]|uniref:hypothetical protein n=1 Tax=Microbacterium sp. 22195 TaxID=3453891 RepID=UPI003F85197C